MSQDPRTEPVLYVGEVTNDGQQLYWDVTRHPDARHFLREPLGLPRSIRDARSWDMVLHLQQKFDSNSEEELGCLKCGFSELQAALAYYGFNILSLTFRDRYTLCATLDVAGTGVFLLIHTFIFGDASLNV